MFCLTLCTIIGVGMRIYVAKAIPIAGLYLQLVYIGMYYYYTLLYIAIHTCTQRCAKYI